MRRSRLKILPSRCVATLGFTLLLLACPTIAEESVRPSGMSENEVLATNAYARIKKAPPEGFEVCKVGDKAQGPINSPQDREADPFPEVASDQRRHLSENHRTLSTRGIAPNEKVIAERSVCDKSWREATGGIANGRMRSREQRITDQNRRQRASSGDLKNRKIRLSSFVQMGTNGELRRSRSNLIDSERTNTKSRLTNTEAMRHGGRDSRDTSVKFRESNERIQSTDYRTRIMSNKEINTDGKILEMRQMKLLPKPVAIQRRTRDTSQKSRIEIDTRNGDTRSVNAAYSEHRDSSRRSQRSASERKYRSTTRSEQTSGRRMREMSEEGRTTEILLRKSRSPVVKSDDLEISQRSSADSRRVVTRPIDRIGETMTRRTRSLPDVRSHNRGITRLNEQDSAASRVMNFRSGRLEPSGGSSISRDKYLSRNRVSLSGGRDTVPAVRELTKGRRLNFRSNPELVQHRERDNSRESRRILEHSKVEEVRSERNSERRDVSRRSQWSLAETNIRSTSRNNQRSERRSQDKSREYRGDDTFTRGTRSLQEIRSHNREISRHYERESTDSRKMNLRSGRLEFSDIPNVRQDNRDSSIKVTVSRARDTVTPFRSAEKEFKENRRMNFRSNLVERRTRDISRESRRIQGGSRNGEFRSAHEAYSDLRDSSRRSHRSSADRRDRSTTRNDHTSERRLRELSRMDRTTESLIRRTRSLPDIRSHNRETTRRYERDITESRRMDFRSERLDSSSGSTVSGDRKLSRVRVSVSGSRYYKTQVRNAEEERRDRDTSRESRRISENSRNGDIMSVRERNSVRLDASRRSQRPVEEINISATTRNNERSERRTLEQRRKYRDSEASNRRTRSLPDVLSHNPETSRHYEQEPADSRRTDSRTERSEHSGSNSIRLTNRESRVRDTVSRARDTLATRRSAEKELTESRRMNSRFNPVLVERRTRDISRESRRIQVDSRNGEFRSAHEAYSDLRDSSRRSHRSLAGRRDRSATRGDHTSERQLRELSRMDRTTESPSRRTRSLPDIRSHNREISRRYEQEPADSRRIDSRTERSEHSGSSSIRLINRESRVRDTVSRTRDTLAPRRSAEKELTESRRMNSRFNPILAERRTRDISRESRRIQVDSRNGEFRSAHEAYSDLRDSSRRSHRSLAGRRDRSATRGDHTSERQLRELSRMDRTTESLTRRTRSLPDIRSHNREISRRYEQEPADSRRIDSRTERSEHSGSNGIRLNNREYRVRDTVSRARRTVTQRYEQDTVLRARDTLAPRRSEEKELTESRRMNSRFNPVLVERRTRDISRESRRIQVDSRNGEFRSAHEAYSDLRDSSRRSHRSLAGRRDRSATRGDHTSERQLRELSRMDRTTESPSRRTRSLPDIRSHNREISRRYEQEPADSRRIDSRTERSEHSGSNGIRLNNREYRVRDTVSRARRTVTQRYEQDTVLRARDTLAPRRSEEKVLKESRRMNSRFNPVLAERRTRDISRESRRIQVDSRNGEFRSAHEAYSDLRDSSRRSHRSLAGRRDRSATRGDHTSERQLRELSRMDRTTESLTRRTRSLPDIWSPSRETTRRYERDTAESRRMDFRSERLESSDISTIRGDRQLSRGLISISRARNTVTQRNAAEKQLTQHRRINLAPKPLLVQRRAVILTRESGKFSEYSRNGEIRPLTNQQRYSDYGDSFRWLFSSAGERNIQSTSRFDQASERRSRGQMREKWAPEMRTVRSKSQPSFNSYIRDINLQSERDTINSRGKDSRFMGPVQITNQINKYSVVKSTPLHIPSIPTMASDNAVASKYLPDLKFIAITFSNGYELLENGYGSLSLGNLTTESSTKAGHSTWTSSLPDVVLHEKGVGESDITTPNAVVYVKVDDQELSAKYNEKEYEGFMQGLDDENFIKMLHPKMTTKDKLFSMAIGGCIAALTISVSSK